MKQKLDYMPAQRQAGIIISAGQMEPGSEQGTYSVVLISANTCHGGEENTNNGVKINKCLLIQ